MKTIASFALFLCCGHLTAAVVTARFDVTAPSSTVQRRILDSTVNTSWTTLTIGMFSMTRTGGDYEGGFTGGAPEIDTSFSAFCIEPQEGVQQGQTYTWAFSSLESGATNIGGMGAARANRIRELMGRFYPKIGVSLTQVQAAALQVALWEIVRETSGTLNVTSGNTRFRTEGTPGVLALAQTYVTSLDGTGPRNQHLYALTVNGNQDILVQTAPEPTTFSLILLAAAPLALRLSRRKR